MIKLIIIGSGHLGQQIYANCDDDIDVVGFLDDFVGKGKFVEGVKVLGGLNDLKVLYDNMVFTHCIIGIGYSHLAFKAKVFKQLKELNIPLFSFISSQAIIAKTSKIGAGCFIMAGTVIDHNVTIGACSVINCSVTVSHDSVIGDFCFLGPGAIISGFVNVAPQCFLGAGSVFKDNVSILNKVVIGAGAVVVKDIVDGGLYIGVPAQLIQKNKF